MGWKVRRTQRRSGERSTEGRNSSGDNMAIFIKIRLGRSKGKKKPVEGGPAMTKYKVGFSTNLMEIFRKIGRALVWMKESFKAALSDKHNPRPDMTYEEWKQGRNNYYDVMDMKRPYYDVDFNSDELRERYGLLVNIFLHQGGAHVPGTPKVASDSDASKIYNEIDWAYKTLVDPKARLLYNVRMDVGDPEVNPKHAVNAAKWLRVLEILLILGISYAVWYYHPIVISGTVLLKHIHRVPEIIINH